MADTGNTAPSTVPNGKDNSVSARGAYTASSHADDIKEEIKDAAKRTAEEARQAAAQKVDAARLDVADHVSTAADAAAAARDELPAGTAADPIMDRAVTALSQAAEHLRHRDLDALARDAGDFARRNPAVALGGAALLGFAVARFLKSGSGQAYAQGRGQLWNGHLEDS